MGKTAFEASRLTAFLMAPEDLVLATDQDSDLYDPRVAEPLSEALVLNVLAIGVQEPIIVRKTDDGRAEVVDGRQRTRAAVEANRRLVSAGAEPRLVPVLPKKGTSDELAAMMYSLNEARVVDSPLVRAGKMDRYRGLGHSEEQVAITFACAVSAVRAHLKLLEMPEQIQDAVGAGRLSLSAASKAARLPVEELDVLLESKAAEPVTGAKRDAGRVTGAELSRVASRASGKAPVKAPGKKEIKEALELRTLPPIAKAALEWVLTGEWDSGMLESAEEVVEIP